MASARLTNRLMLGRRAVHFRLAALLLLLFQFDSHFIVTAEASVGTGTEGRVYGWGRAYWLGVNETDTLVKQKVPTFIHNPASPTTDWTQNFTSLSGKDSVCGVTNTGAGYCLGGATATAVPGNHTWKIIAAGFSHNCGVTTAGVGYCWGTNTNGQLGNGTTTESTNPVAVSGGHTFDSIDVGTRHSCGITTSGLLYCWGANDYYQLGNNVTNQNDKLTPTRVHDPDTPSSNWGTTILKVSLGQHHSCAIDSNNRAYCWGNSWDNNTATGQTSYPKVPKRIHKPNGSANWDATFIDIAAAEEHTCAIKTNGVAYCWGNDSYGSLGKLSVKNDDRQYPVKVSGNKTWVSIATGRWNTCGINDDNYLFCWGKNLLGQLGDNSAGTGGWSATPERVHDPANTSANWTAQWSVAAVGVQRAFGIRTGTAQTITFPDQSDIKLTAGPVTLGATASSGLAVTYASQTSDVCSVTGSTVTLLTTGTCAIEASQAGSATVFEATPVSASFTVLSGDQTIEFPNPGTKNTSDFTGSSLGLSAAASSKLVVSFSSSTTDVCTVSGILVSKVAFGTCTITASQEGSSNFTAAPNVTHSFSIVDGVASGSAWEWGSTPAAMSTSLVFTSVEAGRSHSCGLTAAGTAYCWGANQNGELGNGFGSIASAPPVMVLGGHTWAVVRPGSSSTCGVTTGGNGYCWGKNGQGQLGDGTTTGSLVPMAVTAGDTWATIDPGGIYACGVTTSGAGLCWGNNFYGNLGNGSKHNSTNVEQTSRTQISGNHTWAAIEATDGGYTCGLTTDGAAYCWGTGSNGVLGNGSTTSAQQTPVAVSGGLQFASLSGSEHHICGLTTAGAAHCWGVDSFGQLGTGRAMGGGGTTGGYASSAKETTPQAVAGNLTFQAIAPGNDFFTCGVVTSGQAHCWGRNTRMGTGATDGLIGTSVPTAVSTNEPFRFVSASYYDSVALTKLPQTITFPDPGAKLLAAGTITPGATASSGLSVAYISSTTNVCTITGSTVNLIAFGQCSVTASQAGDAVYLAATDVTRSFNICIAANDCDGDGVTSASDTNDFNPDVDNDGIADGADNCPLTSNADQINADSDSLGNACDSDDDGDGVADSSDNCPLISNADQANSDSDSLGNACDSDDDGDGIADGADNCPLTSNADQINADSDSLGNACDSDDDGDGVADSSDNCPLISNADQANSDSDSLGNACDSDDDGDGVADGADNCPLTSNADQINADSDSLGNACDSDDDGDGVADSSDNCPLISNADQANSDSDSLGNACDSDDDGDGIADGADNCPLTSNADQINADSDSLGNACDSDDDGDGVADSSDNCPLISNADQANFDSDSLGNACDSDDDGDGIADGADNCPLTSNADQINADSDSLGNACDSDDDGDGVADSSDNCPLISNADQANSDSDNAGNVCDTDDDGDGIPDGSDNCPLISNANQLDSDSDDIGDACSGDNDGDGVLDGADNCPVISNANQLDTDSDGIGNACDTDDDGDGIANEADNCPQVSNADQIDTDSDGTGNACDTDDDGDGIAEPVIGTDNCPLISNTDQTDTDSDGVGDACDTDDDGDGVEEPTIGTDNCPLIANADQIDTDTDGIGNACDTDDDADNIPDGTDNCPLVSNADQTDTDGNNIGDACSDDDDADGITDSDDNCPLTSNAEQTDSDTDGTGDACSDDADGDSIPDGTDNCPLVSNTDQTDTDGNNIGDACSDDDDADGITDSDDNCPLTSNAEQTDSDTDGTGDVCSDDVDGDSIPNGTDNCPLVSNTDQTDTDGNNIGDACSDDDDADGITDSDDNCPLTSNAEQTDSDTDGTGDACSDDVDGDSIPDGTDNCPLIRNGDQIDTDADGIGDLCDEDDDNDGVLDIEEVRGDCRVKTDCDDDSETDLTDPFPLAVTSVAIAPNSSITTIPASRLSTCSLILSQAYLSSYTGPDAIYSIGTQAHFSLSGCDTGSPETVTVEVDFGIALPPEGLVCKVDDTSEPLDMSNALIRGNSAIYKLTDNGPFDTNPTLGVIDDPVTIIVLEDNPPTAEPVIPVPINPVWLMIQGVFLSLLAFRALESAEYKTLA